MTGYNRGKHLPNFTRSHRLCYVLFQPRLLHILFSPSYFMMMAAFVFFPPQVFLALVTL